MADDAQPATLADEGHVFVSYAKPDRAFAYEMVRHLEARGLRCWIAPRDITGGEVWAQAITRAIATSSGVLVLLTPAANGSKFVLREVEMAVSANRPMVPVVVSGLALSEGLAFLLTSIQRLDGGPGFDAAVAERVYASLAPIIHGHSSPSATDVNQLVTKIARREDATLWRIYGSTRARLILLAFYGVSMALPYIAAATSGDWLRGASYAVAFVAGATIVRVTREVNLLVLFTMGLVQTLALLFQLLLVAPAMVVYSLMQYPPLPYGLACAAGGLLASLQIGVPGRGAFSFREWGTWIAPMWSLLKKAERLEAVVRIMLVAAAIVALVMSFVRQ